MIITDKRFNAIVIFEKSSFNQSCLFNDKFDGNWYYLIDTI